MNHVKPGDSGKATWTAEAFNTFVDASNFIKQNTQRTGAGPVGVSTLAGPSDYVWMKNSTGSDLDYGMVMFAYYTLNDPFQTAEAITKPYIWGTNTTLTGSRTECAILTNGCKNGEVVKAQIAGCGWVRLKEAVNEDDSAQKGGMICLPGDDNYMVSFYAGANIIGYPIIAQTYNESTDFQWAFIRLTPTCLWTTQFGITYGSDNTKFMPCVIDEDGYWNPGSEVCDIQGVVEVSTDHQFPYWTYVFPKLDGTSYTYKKWHWAHVRHGN